MSAVIGCHLRCNFRCYLKKISTFIIKKKIILRLFFLTLKKNSTMKRKI